MARWQILVLAIAGLIVSAVGLLLAILFAIPALGLNVYGRNPVDFTVEAELASAVIYLAGATMSWFAWDAIGKRGMLRGSVAFLVVPVLVPVGTLAVDVARSYWINVIETLVFVAGILLPVLGASRPWTPGRGLFRGEEPNHR